MGCAVACCSDAPRRRTVGRAGDTVLLLHGSAGNGALWRHAAKALGLLHCCLAPDLIGYGRSDPWPASVSFTLDDECNALKPLLACCPEPLHLVGYSYGGVVALQMALSDPARVRTLTLIEPVFFNALRYARRTDAFGQFVRISEDFRIALARDGAEAAIRPFIAFWTGPGAWDRLSPSARADMLNAAGKVMLDWRAAFALAPDRASLVTLGPRTMLMRGTASPPPMLELVDALHALMPGSSRVIVEGASHLLPLTHAETVTNATLSHLHADAERRLR
jgi:pimeloyl-ACP methyl ester carboxylesterase